MGNEAIIDMNILAACEFRKPWRAHIRTRGSQSIRRVAVFEQKINPQLCSGQDLATWLEQQNAKYPVAVVHLWPPLAGLVCKQLIGIVLFPSHTRVQRLCPLCWPRVIAEKAPYSRMSPHQSL